MPFTFPPEIVMPVVPVMTYVPGLSVSVPVTDEMLEYTPGLIVWFPVTWLTEGYGGVGVEGQADAAGHWAKEA
ncbi:hypothetical protein GCM10010430_71610 [Kitasatospora cystarginea]|uniref:Uncharacterized protein n=1 Tax=Kitasatospora cystarginea TaxID=58350 RepID=A0ABN3EX78_9ACTN